MTTQEKEALLRSRGWSTYYRDDYWVSQKTVSDPSRQDYTDYGMDLDSAVRFEKENLPKFRALGLPALSKLQHVKEVEQMSDIDEGEREGEYGVKEDPTKVLEKLQVYTGDPDFDAILDECRKILGVKGNDYTVGSKDRLANFRKVSEFTGMKKEQVLGVYFYKHVAAIFSYIKSGGQNESEPIEGRIADVINYMLLFYKMVQEEKRVEHGVIS